MINLPRNVMLKSKHQEKNIVDLHTYLPVDDYIKLKSFAQGFVSVFDTTSEKKISNRICKISL